MDFGSDDANQPVMRDLGEDDVVYRSAGIGGMMSLQEPQFIRAELGAFVSQSSSAPTLIPFPDDTNPFVKVPPPNGIFVPTASTKRRPSSAPTSPIERRPLSPTPPYYEKASSFVCPFAKQITEESAMIDTLFEAVKERLDQTENCDYHVARNKNLIKGVSYHNFLPARWEMKVFLFGEPTKAAREAQRNGGATGSSAVSTGASLLVEFRRVSGSSMSFHRFYQSLLKALVKKCPHLVKTENLPKARDKAEFAPLPLDDADLGLAPLSLEEPAMEPDVLKSLLSWASSEFLDQRREGLLALVCVASNHNKQQVLVKNLSSFLKVVSQSLRHPDFECQRLAALCFAHCAGNPSVQPALLHELGTVFQVLKQARLMASEMASLAFEVAETERSLMKCVSTLMESDPDNANTIRNKFAPELTHIAPWVSV